MANSKLEATEAILSQIATDVQIAWPDTIDRVFDEEQIQEQQTLPYTMLGLDSVEMQQQGVRTVEQRHRFKITRVAKFERGVRLRAIKIEEANDLIEILMAGPTYATDGYQPMVSLIDFHPAVDIDSRTEYAFSIAFDVSVENFTIGAV